MNHSSTRVVLVTGATGGIGKVTATRFATEGDRVVLADLDVAAVEQVKAEIEAQLPDASLLALAVDQSSAASLAAAATAITAWAGRLDVIALVAGTVQAEGAPVLELSLEEWDRVHHTNLRGVFLACKTLVPLLGEHAGASVIAVASYWGREAHPFYASYCTSKAGVISFIQVLAAELAEAGIRVNAVAPGNIDTAMHRKALTDEAAERGLTFEQMRDIEYAKIPLRTAGPPKAISDAIYFLSTDEASYMTGATMDVNGGVVFV
ncbi:MAG: SDR family NAD(P)-dependent oxidoreductase [Propioniciclava sp.]